MKLPKHMPALLRLIDIVQMPDGKETFCACFRFGTNRHLNTQSKIAILYQARDGRYVVAVNGRLIDHSSRFIDAGGNPDQYDSPTRPKSFAPLLTFLSSQRPRLSSGRKCGRKKRAFSMLRFFRSMLPTLHQF
jgi:hypothetical protein